jgi:hypothetical protein
MPIAQVKTFLDELATFMAAAMTPPLNYLPVTPPEPQPPLDLFVFEANEANAADVFSVLSNFGGKIDFVSMSQLDLQIMTTGKGNAATIDRTSKLRQTLFDDQGRPWCRKDLTHYRIIGITDVGEPGITGRDEKNRTLAPFNFTVGVVALAAGF